MLFNSRFIVFVLNQRHKKNKITLFSSCNFQQMESSTDVNFARDMLLNSMWLNQPQWFVCLQYMFILQGYDLHIESKGQGSLPETLKKIPVVSFRVTDVDEEEKKNIL